MNKPFLKILLIFVVIAWSGVVFVFGFNQGYKQIPEAPQEIDFLPNGVDFTVLWDVWNTLESKYIDELDYEAMILGAAEGLVKSLGDPYTVFYKPAETVIFKEDIAGSFEGVGMEVTMRDGGLVVVTPLENTPAKQAGILPGDRIIKIEDTNTSDITIEEAVKMIRGEKGTVVNLSIMRDGWDSTEVFSITRASIMIPGMKLEGIEGNIAVISIYQFTNNLNDQFAQVATVLKSMGSDKIILDLRNNPGGLLHEAQNIAGWFIKKGDIVTIEDKGDGETEEYLAKGNEMFLDYPVVILVNNGSASGAEILAAALRDNRDDVQLIGERTFGKGSVQEPVDIRGNCLLKITVASWLTPNGELISGDGLTPDVEIEMTEQDYKEGRDPQLEKAIELLK